MSKSKCKITSAFLELLTRKKLEKVKVKELCELAGVNRKTFYNYYKNLNDLVVEIFENRIDKFINLINNAEGKNYKQFIENLIENIDFDFLMNYSDLYISSLNRYYCRIMFLNLAKVLEANLVSKIGIEERLAHLYAIYFYSAAYAVISSWAINFAKSEEKIEYLTSEIDVLYIKEYLILAFKTNIKHLVSNAECSNKYSKNFDIVENFLDDLQICIDGYEVVNQHYLGR